MRQNKTLQNFNVRKNKERGSPQYERLPQIQLIRSMHEENMRKEKVAQDTRRKHEENFSEQKQSYLLKQKQLEDRVNTKFHECKIKRIQNDKHKNEHLKTVFQNKEGIEKKKQVQRRKMFEQEKKKIHDVLEKHKSEYQAILNQKKEAKIDPRKFKKKKHEAEARESEVLMEKSMERLKNAQQRRNNLSFDENSLVMTLEKKIRRSQQYVAKRTQEDMSKHLNKSLQKQSIHNERMENLMNELNKQLQFKRSRFDDLSKKAKEKRKKIREHQEQNIGKIMKNSEERLQKSHLFRTDSSIMKTQLKKYNRQVKENKVRAKHECFEGKRKHMNNELNLKDHENWNFLTGVKVYKDKIIEKGIYENTALALNK